MDILVIGGMGFVGSSLVEHLKNRNRVTVLDNMLSGSPSNFFDSDGVTYVISDAKDINKNLNRKFDMVFHFGEYSRVEQSFDDRLLALQNNMNAMPAVLEYCVNNSARLIYSGSSTKFSGSGFGLRESPYAFSKHVNSELVRCYQDWFGLDAAVVYFYNVYGPRENAEGRFSTVVAKFLNHARRGETAKIVSPGTQVRNFTHISDILEGIEAVALFGKPEIDYGIGSDEAYSVIELADLIGLQYEMIEERPGNRMWAEVKNQGLKDLGWMPSRNLPDYIKSQLSER